MLVLLLFNSCNRTKNSVVIAQQYGLAYAPVQIMKDLELLEKEMPEYTVKWVQLANTAAIREAALAGDMDAGFIGIPPFLISRDQGMPWKLLCGLCQAPSGLVVPAGRYDSLNSLPVDARIALPQPGSIQHILLGMALKRELGQADFLDDHLISLKHPDGLNALLSGSVDGHFTSPPYLFQESDLPGFEVLLSGEEAMGLPFTFIASVVTEKAVATNPLFLQALKTALEKSILYMKENPEESLLLLSESYDLEKELLRDYLGRSGLIYETELRGVEQFSAFMVEEGYLKNPEDMGGLVF
jgi:NitT/TauT family transport system substrate-binding protein